MKALNSMRTLSNRFNSTGIALLLLCAMAGVVPEAAAQFKLPNATAPKLAPAPSATSPVAAAKASKEPRLVDAIIAVVNNEVITRRELIDRSAIIERRLASQGGTPPTRAELQRQILERMIIERAQLQLAGELGIKVDDMMLDRAVARIAEQNKLSLPEFRKQLESEGTPFAQFREEVRREILMQRLREREVDNKIQVSDSEIDNYLAADASARGSRQELNLAHILVRTPENASPQQIAERQQRAEEAYRQLKSGGDFGKVAAIFSDSDEALKGGALGWRSQDRLPQLFLDAIANVKPGGISPIVKSANGFHILKLVDQRTASAQPNLPPVTQTHARHILIKVNELVSATEAKRKLSELKQRLDNHAATFEELAKLYSNDLSASKGGDLGWIYPGDTVPEFERAMNALQPGQTSEPIESPFGYHLIQVLERKTDDVSRERLRLAARQAIRERKLEEATSEWLRVLRDRAYVEYRFDDNAG
jgi:peptidyl-prolyl cis-trans isomerase SurA